MTTKHTDNRNGFVTPEGQHLGKIDAPLVREVLHANDISIGLLFELWSRMPAPTEFHPYPAATHYGATAVNQSVTVQPEAHDNLNVHPERREAEVDTLESMMAAPAYGEATANSAQDGLSFVEAQDDISREMDELKRDAYDKMSGVYGDA